MFGFKEGVQITAPSGDSKICTQRAMAINDSSSNVAAGQYVLVKFETKRKKSIKYASVIENTDNCEVKVVFLRKQPSGVFVKLAAVDKSWIPMSDIVCTLAPPIVDNQGHYKFDETVDAC